MKLYQNTISRRRYRHWTRLESIAYFIKGIARELGIAAPYFQKQQEKISFAVLKKRWFKQDGNESYFDFNNAKLPDITDSWEMMRALKMISEDVFLIPCFFNDDHSKSVVDLVDPHMEEGPYGYTDGIFDVTVKKGDVVIDVGAWIGDFSAYAASKGATVYAFEPVEQTYKLLCKTTDLNSGQIYAIKKGLGSSHCEIEMSINGSMGNTVSVEIKKDLKETISIVTLDKFVEDNSIKRVDFIKSDIEGAERDMLRGAANVLKIFAPKLAICTYHYPDDPEVLEKIIKDANPAYTVVHLRHKLFAAVIS
jgi:FkbM family methyltransferase